MKRSVAVTVVIAAVCALAVLAGCGSSGNATGARLLVLSGNSGYKAQSEEFADLATEMEKFFAGYVEGVRTGSVVAQDKLDDFQARAQTLLEQVKQSEEPYKKVLAMKGVAQYKEYSQFRLDMLKQIQKTADVIATTFPVIQKAVQRGRIPDVNVLEGAKRELIGIEMELSFTEAQAQELALDRGLKVDATSPAP